MTVLLLLSTPVTVKPIACVEMKDEKSNSILPTEATRLRPRLESFDDVLPYVGDYGRYQWLLLLSLLPYGATYAFLYFSQFFITIIPTEHWCRIDELVNSNFTEEERIKIAIPVTNVYPYYEQCQRKDVNFTELLKSDKSLSSSGFQTNKTIKCTQWEYIYADLHFTQIPYPSIGTEAKYSHRCLNRMLRNSYTSAAFFGSFPI
ncbi:carcinine transporter-like [Bombus huntii]|uniref:carcinine transporter-like n=1 Tax=Bombus huntii TaxID=85661 RepID=UPI0021AB0293|nr:carcinine transporter-like [Bombus huntii]